MRRSTLLVAATLAACAGPVDVGQTAWQGTFPGGPGRITGSVAAVSGSGRTHASIAIQHGTPGQAFGWRIRLGDCQAEGALVGGAASYPVLTVAEDGTAGADVYLSRTMSAGPYAARLVQLQAGGGQLLAACTMLQQTP